MKPSLRVPVADLVEGPFGLDPAASRYVVKVHRIASGDELCVFDPERGLEALARVTRADAQRVLLEVRELRGASFQPLPVCLIQALGKGDKPEQAIVDATVLGAARVVLVETERTIVRGSAERDRSQRYKRVAIEAARQSGRGQLPELLGPWGLAEALEREQAALRLVFAWHEQGRPMLERLASWSGAQALALLIGPEGGLAGAEVTLALDHGFLPTSLGPLVLRTETAATVALGIARARADLG